MKTICFGDSLTFGLTVKTTDKWVYLLQKMKDDLFIQRGIPGDTSGGMLARLRPDVINDHPDRVLIMTGGNDIICGCDCGTVKANIMAMVHQCKAENIEPVVLSEIPVYLPMIPPEWTALCDFRQYNARQEILADWYPRFARSFHVTYIDVFHEFRILPENYTDGIHPSAEGHKLILTTIEKVL